MFTVEPVGVVHAMRTNATDDFWGGCASRIELDRRFGPEALRGLDQFSHVEVLFVFHGTDPAAVIAGARHPRNNVAWPEVGIFAQRAKARPNRLGSTICRLVGVQGTSIMVEELDAIDGTPVLDVKPVLAEFLPRRPVQQPEWSHALMRDYWSIRRE